MSQRKTYRYKDKRVTVADEEDVYFEVKLVSNLNMVQTSVNIPGNNDKELTDSSLVYLGKGKDLRSPITVVFSSVSNPSPNEDEIVIDYFINNTEEPLVHHTNPKSEEERPFILITIHFDEP